MAKIRKVTPDSNEPNACMPYVSGSPADIACKPGMEIAQPCKPYMYCSPQLICTPQAFCKPQIALKKRIVSGTYQSPHPMASGQRIDLRVDVDGNRPQDMLSGDFFNCGLLCNTPISLYDSSFVVETVTENWESDKVTVTGQIKYYNDTSINTHTIEVVIPRVSIFSIAPDATVKFFVNGSLNKTYNCPKKSEFFREVSLEIDALTGTAFPPSVDTHTTPHPADLTQETITCAECFRRAGIDMTVTNDQTLTDSDSSDTGSTWNYSELHDLMEDRWSDFANVHQWNVYGIIVDRMSGNMSGTGYDSGLYGVMFDFGNWQPGDQYLRQGCAIALDALLGRVSGTLYNTAAKQDRFFLETFVHEVGHNFNLPHTWQRQNNPDSASNSFMNYPWGYTGGAGTESAFWSDFRWEFDDVELEWFRHANRPDIIFGGNNWVWNNLSAFPGDDAVLPAEMGVRLEIRSTPVFDFAEPVKVELKLENIAGHSIDLPNNMSLEDGLVSIVIKRPDGIFVRFEPPVHCERGFDNVVALKPGRSLYESVQLSVGAKGPQFAQPGEYAVKAYGIMPGRGMVVSRSHRFRIAAPYSRESEELAHLMFDYKAAKILYLNGSRRYSDTVSKLEEASRKFAKTNPRVVPHIHAALGSFYKNDFKTAIQKDGKWVIKTNKANLKKAAYHLEKARRVAEKGTISPLGNIDYNRISADLVDVLVKKDDKDGSAKILKESISYFENQKVLKSVISDYKNKLDDLNKKNKK